MKCILVGFYDTENLYQLWDIEAKEPMKRRDVIFHEHVMGHPILARESTDPGENINILNQPTIQEEPEVGDELEDLYPVIEELKGKEWEDVPEVHLPMEEDLVVTAQVRDLPRMGIPLPNSDYKTYTYNEI